MKLYDISQEVLGCAVYPGDPAPKRLPLAAISDGDACNLSAFSMCAHNGTHVDAPYHFLNDGATVEALPLSKTVGEAYVALCEGTLTAQDAERILQRARTARTDADRRILIKGDAIVSEEAAEVFAKAAIDLLGVESQTVGPPTAPAAVHRILLGAGAVLLEGVRLAEVSEGAYLLCAAPLSFAGFDGAPCRAILIRTD